MNQVYKNLALFMVIGLIVILLFTVFSTSQQGGQESPFMGRDHNPSAFTIWIAGGGIKPGISYGETDEVGFKAAIDKVHVNDLHATVLHLLGLDHKKLTYRYNGRDFRLTDVAGEVVTGILA